MLKSVRCLAIALFGAVLIGVICAAPVPGENDIQDSSYYSEIEEPELSEPLPSFSTTVRALLPSTTTGSAADAYVGVPVRSTTESVAEGPSSSTVEGLHGSTTTNRVSDTYIEGPSSSTVESLNGSSAEDLASSTTESIARIISKVYGPSPDSPGQISSAGGVLKFRVGQNEDETKRLLEEYNYHFVRVEQGLPHTTKRGYRFNPSS